jgi:hypothetical protein
MAASDRYRFPLKLVLIITTFGLRCICAAAGAQDLNADSDRVFTTPLRWEKPASAPQSEKLRYAQGTLAILYRDGTYAEVAAPFTRATGKSPVELDLSEGFVMRLGTWGRTEDEELIHIQSREVLRSPCKQKPSGDVCSPEPDAPLPGPLTMRTCRLEHHNDKQLAEAIVCEGLTVFHPQKPIDLSDFPAIVRRAADEQKHQSHATR